MPVDGGAPMAIPIRSMVETNTNGIRVSVFSVYLPERSNPERSQYFFAYTVRIANDGRRPAQLVSRHWIITDAGGRVEEVRGPGVVGEQPRLAAGESFEYTSGCPLRTANGTMHGTYQMAYDNGETFDAEIPMFGLAVPGALN